MTTLTEFLLARIAEDEAPALERLQANGARRNGKTYARRIALECDAKRRIVEWHENWPVLVQTEPVMEPLSKAGEGANQFVLRMTQQILWATEREYRARFGTEPPTGPILRLLALPYADHPDYAEAWRS